MRVGCLILILFLGGCLEDKEKALAECRLKYDKGGRGQDEVLLCMRVEGYEFASGWEDDKFTTLNAKCWNGTNENGRAFPITPDYILYYCYDRVSYWKTMIK